MTSNLTQKRQSQSAFLADFILVFNKIEEESSVFIKNISSEKKMSSENQIAQSSTSLVPVVKSDTDLNGKFSTVCDMQFVTSVTVTLQV